MTTISPAVARRTALAAQGFADPQPSGPVTRRHLGRVLDRVKLLQLDSVNVLQRAHYLPAFSRLGGYDTALLDDVAWGNRPRRLVECWAHEASLVPVADWPLLRSEAKRPGWWTHYEELAKREPQLVADILAVVREHGPIGAGGIEKLLTGGQANRRTGPWWGRSETKRVCEWLFGRGQLLTGTRRSFERLYDLPERVVPQDIREHRPDPAEAARELISRAAQALGVATEPDLRDYYRIGPKESRTAVGELVDAGVLQPVTVDGWRLPAYRHVAARTPRRITGAALLSPFDSLIWFRERTERLFGFHYRIEIYVPEPKRRFGYYVLPFLLDGELVARVDLKADRANAVLRVLGAFAEPGHDGPRTVAELRGALERLAAWLGLGDVVVGDRGDLAGPLRARAAGPGRG